MYCGIAHSFQVGFKKFLWIHTEPVELVHGHAGITGSPSIGKALPDLKMKVIWCAEIGLLQLGSVEEAGKGCVFVDPISRIHVDIFNVSID